MTAINLQSKAATILLRRNLGLGYRAGRDFPGATIRHAHDALFRAGYLEETPDGRIAVSAAGRAFLLANHLEISL